ncbi:TonB family protein [Faucicola mancuniensis]|uniref:TonB family protein n=1 Tax=Faucicola mancuniensis TaxID=1309795 RepID=UPI0028EEBD0B|nr:TonB family protein [uncultured Moraxella sp.]
MENIRLQDWFLSLLFHFCVVIVLVLIAFFGKNINKNQVISLPIRWVAVEQNSIVKNDETVKPNEIAKNEEIVKTDKQPDKPQSPIKNNVEKSLVKENPIHKHHEPKSKQVVSQKPKTFDKNLKNTPTDLTKQNLENKNSENSSKTAVPTTVSQAQGENHDNQTPKKAITKITNTQVVTTEQISQNATPQKMATPKPQASNEDNGTKTNLAQWQSRFIASVNQSKRYPKTARNAGIQGSSLLNVNASLGGVSCRLKRSSGFDVLDNEAMNACQKAISKNPMPDNSTNFDVSVDYVLNH